MSEHKTAWQAYCETPEICPDGRMQADDAEIARLRWMNARLVEIAQREADRSHESARRAVTAEARVRELEGLGKNMIRVSWSDEMGCPTTGLEAVNLAGDLCMADPNSHEFDIIIGRGRYHVNLHHNGELNHAMVICAHELEGREDCKDG